MQPVAQNNHTPPMSPADRRSSSPTSDERPQGQSDPQKGSTVPSQSSIQSNPFTTPPTSPAQPKDEIDYLFDMTDSQCSQFDLEMKAMGDFTSLDNNTYDFVDFSV